MRCLIIAPSHTRLDVLTDVLHEEDIQALASVELGGGSLLASAPLDDVAFALVVLPDGRRAELGLSALLVEAGIVLGRGIPTLVLTDPEDEPPAALGSVPHAAVLATDADALRMHVRVFARLANTAPASPSSPAQPQVELPTPVLSPEQRTAIRAMASGEAFEAVVLYLLQQSGAVVEERVGPRGEGGVDVALGVPGPAGTSMVVLVEVKRTAKTGTADLQNASRQLLNYMATRRADLGLIITSEPVPPAAASSLAPRIIAMSAEELVQLVNRQNLNRYLMDARNRAVHGV